MDCGTRFGLMTPGVQIEYYLYEPARWEYMSDLGQDEDSEEGKILSVKTAREWV